MEVVWKKKHKSIVKKLIKIPEITIAIGVYLLMGEKKTIKSKINEYTNKEIG